MFSRGLIIILIFFCFLHCKQKEISNTYSKEKILRQLDQAIEDHPFNDSLYYLRGRYYYQKGEYTSAQSDLDYAIKLDSLAPDYYHLLADAYIDHGQSFEGLETMKHASVLFPDRIPTLLKLCEFENILKQYDQSLETIMQILKLDPSQAQAYLMAGINLRDMKDTANAIKNLTKATTYDDHLTDAWIILGQLYQYKDFPLAKTYFNNAIRLDSNDINTLSSYASFIQETAPSKALAYYHRIISIDPRLPEAYLNAGILYFKIDSFNQSLEQFNILCQVHSTEPLYYYYRGTVKEAMNNNTGAREDFDQAIRLNPNYTEAKAALNALKK